MSDQNRVDSQIASREPVLGHGGHNFETEAFGRAMGETGIAVPQFVVPEGENALAQRPLGVAEAVRLGRGNARR